MKVFIFVFVNCFVLGLSHAPTNILSVPEDVMSFIMACDGRFSDTEGPRIPVTRTAIDTASGTETKEVSMMNIGELRQSLLDTVEGEEVVSQILAQVEESLAGRQVVNEKDKHCTNVKIEVPQQEVKGLSEQLQAVVQQNNYQLLEQVNTLFSFKLNSFYKEFEEMIEKKLAELGAGLIQFQQAQQAAAAQKPSEASAPEPESSIGETRIFLSNTPVQSYPPAKIEHVAGEVIPEEDYVVEEQIVESGGFSASDTSLDQPLDYENNEVPMEKTDTDETVQHAGEDLIEQEQSLTSQSTSQSTTQSTTQSSATPSTTQSTTQATTTSTTTTTTTTTPAPEPLTTGLQESARSSYRRRRPDLGLPRRTGLRRKVILEEEVPIPLEEEEVVPPKEVEDKADEDKDSESLVQKRTKMEQMRKRRKEMLERLRG